MGNKLEKPEVQESELNLPPENHTVHEVFTCEICIEPFSSRTQKFKNKNLCTHPFCVDCVIKYIQVKLEESVGEIPCPALHCDNIFDPIPIRPLLCPSLFNKWCDLLCDSTLLEVDRCYCPYEDCSALVINECGGDVKKSMSPNCKRWFCFKCNQRWHAGFMCEETKEMRDGNDVAFGMLAEREKWIRCPRCRHFIGRIDGCNFINCRCGSCFCYECGEQFQGGNCGCNRSPGRRSTCHIIMELFTIMLCFCFLISLFFLSKLHRFHRRQT